MEAEDSPRPPEGGPLPDREQYVNEIVSVTSSDTYSNVTRVDVPHGEVPEERISKQGAAVATVVKIATAVGTFLAGLGALIAAIR